MNTRSKKVKAFDIIVKSANNVFDGLGAGHQESVYRNAMVTEFQHHEEIIGFSSEVPLPFIYKDSIVGHGRADIIINTKYEVFIIELKAQGNGILDKWILQVQKYLNSYKHLGISKNKLIFGIIINFQQKSITHSLPI